MKKRILSLFLALACVLSFLPLSPAYAEEIDESRYVQQPSMANGMTAGVDTEGVETPTITYTWYTKEEKDLSSFTFDVNCGTVSGNSVSSAKDEFDWDVIDISFTDYEFDQDTFSFTLSGERQTRSMDGSIYDFSFEPFTFTDVKITRDKVLTGETAATLSQYTIGCLYRCDITLNGTVLKGEWVRAGYALTYSADSCYYYDEYIRYAAGDRITLDNDAITSGGDRRLIGWNTEEDGSGTDYDLGATYTFGNADATFYAVWAPLITGQPTAENDYTITVDPYFTDTTYRWYRLDTVGGNLSEAENCSVSTGSRDGNTIQSEECDGYHAVDFSLQIYYGRPATISFDCDRSLNVSWNTLLSLEGNRYTYALDNYGNFSVYDETEPFTLSNITYTTTEETLMEGQETSCFSGGELGKEYYCYVNAGDGDYYAGSESFVYTGSSPCSAPLPVCLSSLKDGTYKMSIGGMEIGTVEFSQVEEGFTLRDTASGQYICAGEDEIYFSDTPDTVWSKGSSSFYIIRTCEVNIELLDHVYTLKSRLYLSVNADGALTLSHCALPTTLFQQKEYTEHLYVRQWLADGTHRAICLRCGKSHIEKCTCLFGRCTLCGGVNLKRQLTNIFRVLQTLRENLPAKTPEIG